MTQTRKMFLINILSVLFLSWVLCEQLGEPMELTVKEEIASPSTDDHTGRMSDVNTKIQLTALTTSKRQTPDMFTPEYSVRSELEQPDEESHDFIPSEQINQNAFSTFLIEDASASVLNDFSPSYSCISPQLSDKSPTYQCVFPLFYLELSTKSERFQISEQGLVSDTEMLQTSEGLSLDTEIFQTSLQGLFSETEVFQTSKEGFDSATEIVQTNEEGLFNLFSNVDVLWTSTEGLVSSGQMPRTNKEKFFSGTEMFQTSSLTLSLDDSHVYQSTQRTPHHLLHLFMTSDNPNEIIVKPTLPKDSDVTMTPTADMCSTDMITSLCQTCGSMASSATYSIAAESGLSTILPTAQNLTITTLPKHSGFITTPGFSDRNNYPNNINDTHCFSIDRFGGQTLLLSFPYFHLESWFFQCRYDYLELLEGDSFNNKTTVWKKCGIQMIPTEMLNGSVVCLHFVSNNAFTEMGFNVTYSILPGTVTDYKLDNNFINCSAIDSYHRSLHFDCNLVLECMDGQDEMNCNYSSKECPGLVSDGEKCYTSNVRRNITWFEANKECTSINQTLVSPQSPQEWNAFVNILPDVERSYVIYVGLQNTGYSSTVSPFYRNTWQWSTRTTAFYFNVLKMGKNFWPLQPACVRYIPTFSNMTLWIQPCAMPNDILVMCQNQKMSEHQSLEFPHIQLKNNSYPFPQAPVQCTSKYLVRNFLKCDLESNCHDDLSQRECQQQSTEPTPELFSCLVSTTHSVHYTLLCDHKSDCPDGSDESFCTYEQCPEDTCRNKQCIAYGQRCDGLLQCLDWSDENCPLFVSQFRQIIPSPLFVNYDIKGSFTVQSLNGSDSCPETHFQCKNLDCLPVYLRCNEVSDCPDREDEIFSECEESTCPGFLRCRGSKICVHPNHTCDRIPHCPQHDDEMLCNTTCPQHCNCQGLAFICTSNFTFHLHPDLRYLHIGNFSVSVLDLTTNPYLVLLRLSNCELKSLSMVKVISLNNLQTLDLRDNILTSVEVSIFDKFPSLRSLILSGNPLTYITFPSFINHKLKSLDLSYTSIRTVSETLLVFSRLKTLNFSNSALKEITNEALNFTLELQYLDLRGTSLKSYPIYMLRHLSKLKHVWANDFKLCCKAALPEGFDLEQCDATQDDIASCDDLLRSTTYKTFLWIVALFALIGNAGSFISRLLIAREFNKNSFGVFVLNLSISDFLMGVYLTMIGVADQMFRGQYWWRADIWKQSVACKTAGFLSLLSSEVSAFFISLITIDRFLVLRFPFSRFHFGRTSALVACVFSWTIGLVLAGIPLLPLTAHWDFFGQTGICLPLPFTKRGSFPGYFYSFSVMIILNFVLFMFIALGQAIIYWSVQTSHKSQIRKNVKSSDAAIARRLIAIVLTDFMCWFPTGILGLLAFAGNDIHSDINITVAIFVMPLNSALNPFLYTLNLVMEKRRKATEARLMLRLQATMQSDVTRLDAQLKRQSKDMTVGQMDNRQQDDLVTSLELVSRSQPKEAALNQIDKWLKEGLLSLSDIVACVDITQKQLPE